MHRIGSILLAFSAAAAGLNPALAGPASLYDGRWAVEVVPENGQCSGRYVMPVEVVGDRIVYIGQGDIRADGGVATDGSVRVSFSSADDRVVARGQLSSESFGHGSWQSPTEGCDGTWIARKG